MPAPSALAPNEPMRVMLFAGESVHAEAILRTLLTARVPVRGLYTQHPSRLVNLVHTHPCNLIIAWLSGDLVASELAAGYRELQFIDQAAGTDPPPLLVLYDEGRGLAELGELATAGASAMLEATDQAALVAAVRRHERSQRLSARLAALEAEDAAVRSSLRMLVTSVDQPMARVCAGLIVEVNPTFARMFGGGDAATLTDRPLKDLVVPADQAALTTLLGANLLLELPSTQSGQLSFIGTDGTSCTCWVQAQPCGLVAPQCQWLLLQPAAARVSDGAATVGAPVDERAALRAQLDAWLAGKDGLTQSFALIWALVPGYADWLRTGGFEQVEAGMATLREAVAAAAPATARIARLTDDSFAVLLPDVDRADRGGLRARFASQLVPSPQDGELSVRPPVSVGVMVAEPGEFTLWALLDQARAEAQRGGQPRPVPALGEPVNEPPARPMAAAEAGAGRPRPLQPARGLLRGARQSEGDAAAAQDPDSIEARVERALGANALGVMYQPIISLMGDSQEHYSVLLRLEDANQSMLSAAELLQAAARSGNLPAVDRWVISKALGELARQRRNGHKVGLFLSLSAETMQEEDLLVFVCDVLRENDVLGSWLTFQAQEREVRANLRHWVTLCERLRSINSRVAINQFGHDPGPAELLAASPVDFVKFAPEFAIGLADDSAKQRRLADLAKLVRDHNCRSIVSGVEDPATLTILWGNTMDYVQGNFLQMPSYTLDPPGE